MLYCAGRGCVAAATFAYVQVVQTLQAFLADLGEATQEAMKEKGIAFQWSAGDTDNGSTDVTTSAGSGQNKSSLADMKTKRFLMHKAGFEKGIQAN